MKDNAVNSNKQHTQKPYWELASHSRVTGMGVVSPVVIRTQLIRLSSGIWWVGCGETRKGLGELSIQVGNDCNDRKNTDYEGGKMGFCFD